jgi:hypothetical protein
MPRWTSSSPITTTRIRNTQTRTCTMLDSLAPRWPPRMLPIDQQHAFGPPDLAGAPEQRNGHKRRGDRREDLQRVGMRQVEAAHQDQHQQQIGRPVEDEEAEAEGDEDHGASETAEPEEASILIRPQAVPAASRSSTYGRPASVSCMVPDILRGRGAASPALPTGNGPAHHGRLNSRGDFNAVQHRRVAHRI